ncbi:hypothetical protein MJO29_012713 [Puccinia striiformis f. sp. tritici]|uniref:Uncharacterized protein n=1 Tax=Puccinia striiformis TaxID=27350 RepID=A0A2S4WDV3_9BASI|nr:hypothetical protein MJO29_012713 [Puccinia striiformis f. sp. tritici]POW19918.1 hypothetical protein PSHT_04046 [Puccinia striiformis]
MSSIGLDCLPNTAQAASEEIMTPLGSRDMMTLLYTFVTSGCTSASCTPSIDDSLSKQAVGHLQAELVPELGQISDSTHDIEAAAQPNMLPHQTNSLQQDLPIEPNQCV